MMSSSSLPIPPQNLDLLGQLAEVRQGVLHPFFIEMPQEVQIKMIFPRPAGDEAGFDTRQAEVAQRKDGQGTKEGSRAVPGRENDRDFIGARNRPPLAIEQNEAREVLLVVFDAAAQHARAVFARR